MDRKKEPVMSNVYVEPHPTGHAEGTAVDHYTVEYRHGAKVTPENYQTQEAAIKAAKGLGHHPLIARVRSTSKGNPDHWRNE